MVHQAAIPAGGCHCKRITPNSPYSAVWTATALPQGECSVTKAVDMKAAKAVEKTQGR